MQAFELLTGYVTAPGTTLTNLTMASGNSKTIRNAPQGSNIKLISAWNDNQTRGILRIKSPYFPDNVQGIRLIAGASQVLPLLPFEVSQPLTPQDTLEVALSGSATAGDIETACMLVYYEDLPGIAARLISPQDLRSRMVGMISVENTLALGTAGGYSGNEALNAEYDLLKNNTDYAILGYIVSVECACIRYRGTDFGNLGLGGPGNEVETDMTKDWFVRLSQKTGIPLIPVFNSADIGNVIIDGAQDENGTDTTVTTILAQLN